MSISPSLNIFEWQCLSIWWYENYDIHTCETHVVFHTLVANKSFTPFSNTVVSYLCFLPLLHTIATNPCFIHITGGGRVGAWQESGEDFDPTVGSSTPKMTAEAIAVEDGKADKAGGCTSCGCSLRTAAA